LLRREMNAQRLRSSVEKEPNLITFCALALAAAATVPGADSAPSMSASISGLNSASEHSMVRAMDVISSNSAEVDCWISRPSVSNDRV
jgi:hypothetical protein